MNMVSANTARALRFYDDACSALAKAKAVDEAKEIADRAEAMRVYARQARNRELEADAYEIRERAEVRLGELIKAQKAGPGLNKGAKGNPGGQGAKIVRSSPTTAQPKLSDAGITKDLSSRAQKKARLPGAEAKRLIERGRNNIIAGRPAKNILQVHREEQREKRKEEDKKAAERVDAAYVVHHSGVDDVTPEMLADASVDAIITDPPYPQKFLPTFSSLSHFAARVLKPGGWCVVMTGNAFLPEVIQRLGERLTYRWQYVVFTPGGRTNRNPAVGLFQAYKPVLLYQKPPVDIMREYWPDAIKADASEYDKSDHPWQQSQAIFEVLVNRFTMAGNIVVDPFAGSGTTGRAAISQGRHFWGCDIDPECAT